MKLTHFSVPEILIIYIRADAVRQTAFTVPRAIVMSVSRDNAGNRCKVPDVDLPDG
ncbi:MAG: hypothetical protein ACLR1R_10065 [Ruminococcus callidus]